MKILKGVCLLTAVSLVCVVLIGIGLVSAAGNTYDLKIIIAADNRPYFEYIAKQWKAKTGGNIEIISQSYNTVHDKVVSSVMGGGDVDLALVDTIWPGEFAVADMIVPLNKYITKEMRDKMVPVMLDQMIWDGKITAMPLIHEDKWLYYNKDILKKAGFSTPPKTLEELVSMSKVIMKKGLAKYGIAWGWGQHEGLICDWAWLLHDFGGKWRDKDGKWIFNNQAGQQALEWMIYTIKEGIADPASITFDDRTVLNTFMQGNIPFVVDWSFAWAVTNDPKESKVAGKVGIALIPGVPSAGTVSSSVTGGGGYAIMKTCKKPDIAWEFIKLLTERENMVAALGITNNPPIWKDIYTDKKVLEKYPQFKDMYPQYQYACIRPMIPWYSEWSQQVQVEIHNALVGKKSAKKALDDAVKFSNEKSKAYGY